jgi:hypothetical protein
VGESGVGKPSPTAAPPPLNIDIKTGKTPAGAPEIALLSRKTATRTRKRTADTGEIVKKPPEFRKNTVEFIINPPETKAERGGFGKERQEKICPPEDAKGSKEAERGKKR